MNKRLKEILKEYEKRKHKIIKGDESMYWQAEPVQKERSPS